MIQLDRIIRQMTANAEAVRSLLQNVTEEQARWRPTPETWSMFMVMHHVYNEERIDFRKHLKEIFSDPPLPWEAWHPEELLPVESLQQAVESFLLEREASIQWLKNLEAPDWDIQSQAPWGAMSAGDVLVSWEEHDYLHLRQIIEVLHALNVEGAAPYSVKYAGDW